jgi:carbamate kinase
MRIVVALGGNALLPRGQQLTMTHQREAVRAASAALAEVAADHQLVVTHGNGPQVGLLAMQATAYDADTDFTLDVLDAESAGMVGYVVEQEVGNRLPAGRGAVTVLTTTLVSRDDPAFADPTKFVGPVYDAEQARRLEQYRGWTFRPDGAWHRRVVPSPAPLAVEPVQPIGVLLDLGYVVVCGGGGGVPVCSGPHGLEGVEAVVDKDAVSALIAEQLGADLLVIATDVAGVFEGWGGPEAHLLRLVDIVDLEHHVVYADQSGHVLSIGFRPWRRSSSTASSGGSASGSRSPASAFGWRPGRRWPYWAATVQARPPCCACSPAS